MKNCIRSCIPLLLVLPVFWLASCSGSKEGIQTVKPETQKTPTPVPAAQGKPAGKVRRIVIGVVLGTLQCAAAATNEEPTGYLKLNWHGSEDQVPALFPEARLVQTAAQDPRVPTPPLEPPAPPPCPRARA